MSVLVFATRLPVVGCVRQCGYRGEVQVEGVILFQAYGKSGICSNPDMIIDCAFDCIPLQGRQGNVGCVRRADQSWRRNRFSEASNDTFCPIIVIRILTPHPPIQRPVLNRGCGSELQVAGLFIDQDTPSKGIIVSDLDGIASCSRSSIPAERWENNRRCIRRAVQRGGRDLLGKAPDGAERTCVVIRIETPYPPIQRSIRKRVYRRKCPVAGRFIRDNIADKRVASCNLYLVAVSAFRCVPGKNRGNDRRSIHRER